VEKGAKTALVAAGVLVAVAVAIPVGIAVVTGTSIGDLYCSGDGFRCIGNCKLPVKVVSCGDPGVIDMQYQLSVCSPNKITWELPKHGAYKFDHDNGIAFKQNYPDFDPTAKDPQDDRYTWPDAHNNLGVFDYGVKILNAADNSVCAHIDPRISNE
jgi:hypothetical protein